MLPLVDDRDQKKTARARFVLVRAAGYRSRADVADPLKPTSRLHVTILPARPSSATWAGIAPIAIGLRLGPVYLDLPVVY
jgi:hypothetical protein